MSWWYLQTYEGFGIAYNIKSLLELFLSIQVKNRMAKIVYNLLSVMGTHSSSLPAKRARCGGRGPPMVVGKPSPVSAVVSGVSVDGGTGGATCK